MSFAEDDAFCNENNVAFIGPLYEQDAHSWFEGADGFEYLLDDLGATMDESAAEGGSPLDGINRWVANEVRAAEKDGVRLCPKLTFKWAVESGIYHIARGYDMCRMELRWHAASVIETIDAHSPTVVEARALARVVVKPFDSLAHDVAWDIDFQYAALRIGDARTLVQFDEMVADLRRQLALHWEVCGTPVMSAALPHVATIALEDWQGNALRSATMSWHQSGDGVEEVPVKEESTDDHGARS